MINALANNSTCSSNTPKMNRRQIDLMPSMADICALTFEILNNPSSAIFPESDTEPAQNMVESDKDCVPPPSPTKLPNIFSKLNRKSSFRKAVTALTAPITKGPQDASSPKTQHNRTQSVKHSRTKSKDEIDTSNIVQKRHLSVPKDISQIQMVDVDLLNLLGKYGRTPVGDSSSMSILSTTTNSAASLLALDESSRALRIYEQDDKGLADPGPSFEFSDSDEDNIQDVPKKLSVDESLKKEDTKMFTKTKIVSKTTMEEDKSILLKSPEMLEMLEMRKIEMSEGKTCRRDSERRGEETLFNTLLNKNVTLTYRGDVIREQFKQQDFIDTGEMLPQEKSQPETSNRNRSPDSEEVVQILVGDYGSKDSSPPIFHDAKPIVTIEPPSPMPEHDSQSYTFSTPSVSQNDISFIEPIIRDDLDLETARKRQRRPTKWRVKPLDSENETKTEREPSEIEDADLSDTAHSNNTSTTFFPPFFPESHPIVTIEPPTPMSRSVADELPNLANFNNEKNPNLLTVIDEDVSIKAVQPKANDHFDFIQVSSTLIDALDVAQPNNTEDGQKLDFISEIKEDNTSGFNLKEETREDIRSKSPTNQLDIAEFADGNVSPRVGKQQFSTSYPCNGPEECFVQPYPSQNVDNILDSSTNDSEDQCIKTTQAEVTINMEHCDNSSGNLTLENLSGSSFKSSNVNEVDIGSLEYISDNINDENAEDRKAACTISTDFDDTNHSQHGVGMMAKNSTNKYSKKALENDYNVDDLSCSSRSRSLRCVSLPPKLCPLLITNNTTRFLNIMSRRSEISIGKRFDMRRIFRCSCRTCLKSSLSVVSKSLPNLTVSVFLSPPLPSHRSCLALDQEKSRSCSKINEQPTSTGSEITNQNTSRQESQPLTSQNLQQEKTEDNDKSPESETGCSPPKGMADSINKYSA